ncbi:hypothetical protein J2128_001917 [Methanomicrobium sp. W14]|uniref:peptidase domain-containing protein n=1 Tax=Methanomicrobium sp. W14 TaxID=2817839 RepID=UPI001AE2E7F5|nr:peptidase domain-containing protein [Methanomicrobium sp. W14]MBP2133951.1 hypothetical protein [Methanomicrobium sp. W14]
MNYYSRIIAISILALLFLTCTASAEIIQDKSGYIIRTGDDIIKSPGTMISMDSLASSLHSIKNGQTNYYNDYVSSGKNEITYELEWKDSENDLGLLIRTPYTSLGFYHDSSDGRIDGKIVIQIYKNSGLEKGLWSSKVKGFSVSGTEHYNWKVTIE